MRIFLSNLRANISLQVTPGQHATEVTEVLESTPGPDTSATTSATQAARASTTSTPLAAAGDASPTSAARRGLRTRTPAQQRPYWHHNKVFEEIDDSSVKPSSTIKSKLGTVSYADDDDDDEEEETLDVDDNDSDVEMVAVEQSPPRTTPRKFKGKGRAWKKEGEDEDGDYRVASSVKKALQQPPEPAPVDQPPPKKKRGRPRKSLPNPLTKDLLAASPQSQPQSAQGTRGGGTPDVFSLYSAADLRTASDLDSPANPPPTAGDEQTEQTKGYRQRRPRRPHKSEEFVREDDSDLDSDNDLLTSKDSRRPNPDDRGPNLTGKPRLVVTLKTCIRPRASSEPPPTQTALSGGDLFTRPKPPRRPRMRKSFLSQEFVGADDSDLEDGGGDGEGKGVNGVMERQPTPVKRRRNRKSHLSEEFVRDESSDDEEMGEGDTTLGSETPAPAAGRDADGDVRMVNGDEDHDDGLVSPKQTFATPKRKSTAMNDGNGNTHSPAASAKPASTKKGKPAQQPMKFTPRKGYTASGKKIGRPPKNRQSGALATNTTPRSSAKSSVPDLESSAPAADSPSAKSSSTLTPSRRGRPKRVNIVDDTEI